MDIRMLSDRFVKEEMLENSHLSAKITRLEVLSISMTDLINSGNSQKIRHLEKLRQKILKDIIKKNEPIDENLQPKISNIFDLNNKMIEKVKKEKVKSLKFIKQKIKCYKTYGEI